VGEASEAPAGRLTQRKTKRGGVGKKKKKKKKGLTKGVSPRGITVSFKGERVFTVIKFFWKKKVLADRESL